MPITSKLPVALSMCTALIIPGQSNSTLIDRGSGLIYDTELDITWLANPAYGFGSSQDNWDNEANGRMDWFRAMEWVEALEYTDSIRNVVWNDWRLPTTLQPDPSCSNQTGGSNGYNCTDSELGHLFYVGLGGTSGQPLSSMHNEHYYLFDFTSTNQVYGYWSSTEVSTFNTSAWYFSGDTGTQGYNNKLNATGYAWAVRDGDVGSAGSVVPLPASIWLLSAGFLWLTNIARWR